MKQSFNIYALSYLICIIILIIGCKKNDWYDIKSDKGLAIPATLKDMQALLDNVSIMNDGSIGIGEVGSDGHYIKDNVFLRLGNNEHNAYTWSNDKPYISVADWAGVNNDGAYPKIYYCNLVLEGLKKISPTDNNERLQWNNIMGQALFQRARSFYELTQVFAPPFDPISANIDLGIPLRLESDINIPSKRSTVTQNYEQIIKDLNASKELLTVTPLYKTRASKPAVFALLARIYLSMEEYENAGACADSCLLLYNTLLNYNSIDTNLISPFPIFNSEVIFHARMLTYTSTLTNMFIDQDLYALYNDNDLRKTVFFKKNFNTGEIKTRGNYTGSIAFFSGLATDEIYLIRAECFARANNVNKAMEDLNTLLRKRWKDGTFSDLTTTNSEDALKKILEERKRELLLRGLRWSDLRRLNRDERFKTVITRIISDIVYRIEPGSYKYTLPIPDDIIQIAGLAQNPGWSK